MNHRLNSWASMDSAANICDEQAAELTGRACRRPRLISDPKATESNLSVKSTTRAEITPIKNRIQAFTAAVGEG